MLASQHPSLGFTRSREGVCAPWPVRPLYTSEPVTRALLATLADRMLDSLTARRLAFLRSGTVDVRATTTIANVLFDQESKWIMRHPIDLGTGPLTSYFTNSNLYCCVDVCPTWCVRLAGGAAERRVPHVAGAVRAKRNLRVRAPAGCKPWARRSATPPTSRWP